MTGTLPLPLLMMGLGQAAPPEPVHWNVTQHPYCPIQSIEPLEGITESAFYVKGDAVNLRTGPSTSSDILMELSLGTKVSVFDCEREEVLGGQAGCWHPIKVESGQGMFYRCTPMPPTSP